ncbi:MAG: MCE family protein [Bacteroidetes bacterium]|nr:MCE family protein [Bacteroidota bacterium]
MSKEVKVGLTITLALVALIWGLNYLKGTDLFTSTNNYYAVYNNVGGLVKSNPVILNGFKIGQVEKIEFLEDKSGRMVVKMLINDDVFIPKSATANITSSDLLGGKTIEIIYGDDKTPAPNNDTLKSSVDGTLTDQIKPFKDKAESLVVSLDSLSNSLSTTLNEGSRTSLQRSIANFEKATDGLNELINGPNSKLKLMLANVEHISNSIKNNMDEFDRIMKNFATMSDTLAKANLASTLENANKALAQTNQIMTKINNGQGSLGLLLNNDSLYYNLNNSAADLDKLLIDLKANPKRYIHFSVFGKKQQ